MNNTLLTTLLAAALLGACATAPSTSTASAKAASPAVVCVDENPTGSNIKRRRCYANDAESQRQRQAQIDALRKPGRANSGATAQQ